MRIFLLSLALLAFTACHSSSDQSDNQAASAGVGIRGVHRDFHGKAAPDVAFIDPDGKQVRIASFKGRPVLVNLWASWCAPCVKELPTLDQVARRGQIEVLAVSQDNGPHASVVAFLKQHHISTLGSFQDPNSGLSGALGPDTVLPTSILFDSNGKEVWRFIGDQDWTTSDASKLLSEGGGAPGRG